MFLLSILSSVKREHVPINEPQVFHSYFRPIRIRRPVLWVITGENEINQERAKLSKSGQGFSSSFGVQVYQQNIKFWEVLWKNSTISWRNFKFASHDGCQFGTLLPNKQVVLYSLFWFLLFPRQNKRINHFGPCSRNWPSDFDLRSAAGAP